MMQRKRLALAAALLAVAALAVAQEEKEPTFVVGTREVIAPTTVLDKDGAYIAGIKAQEFRLYDNDKLQQIKVDEIYAPLSGRVVARNDQLEDAPELINTDPYGAGWLIEIEPADGDLDALLGADAYRQLTES